MAQSTHTWVNNYDTFTCGRVYQKCTFLKLIINFVLDVFLTGFTEATVLHSKRQ